MSLVIEKLPTHLMLSCHNWLSFRENLNCQAFSRSRDRAGSERCVLTHSYEAGWKIRHQTSISDQCLTSNFPYWSLFSSKKVIKVLPAFEPCLLQPFRSLRTIWKAGFETIDINFAYSRTQILVSYLKLNYCCHRPPQICCLHPDWRVLVT